MFAAVVGEEQGLYGSKHLAERAKAENWELIAMLNNDIVGNSHGHDPAQQDTVHLRVFSEGVPATETAEQAQLRRQLSAENDSPSRQLARYARTMARAYIPNSEVVLEYRPDRFLRGGDHTPFNQQGFPAVRFTEMHEDFRHQHQDLRTEADTVYGDLPEFMDFRYLRKTAGVNLATLAGLAAAPAAPVAVEVLTAQLTNRTQLRWSPPAAGPPPRGLLRAAPRNQPARVAAGAVGPGYRRHPALQQRQLLLRRGQRRRGGAREPAGTAGTGQVTGS